MHKIILTSIITELKIKYVGRTLADFTNEPEHENENCPKLILAGS